MSCDFKKDEFISLYRDIDDYYGNRRKLSFASFCTVLSIKGYYEVVKPLYLLRKKLGSIFLFNESCCKIKILFDIYYWQ